MTIHRKYENFYFTNNTTILIVSPANLRTQHDFIYIAGTWVMVDFLFIDCKQIFKHRCN